MALTQVPIELSSTPGIVDNSNDTAITIDSSENVLVGTDQTPATLITTSTTSHEGVGIADGYLAIARNLTGSAGSGGVAFLNRLATDGPILDLRKDGTSVGSIGSRSGTAIYIDSAGTGTAGLDIDGAIAPRINGSLDSGGNVDLGASAYRFRDLYLSGGVYLGGTGSANKLDDYEEGTWTPVDQNGNAYTPNVQASYTKIGRLVYFNFDISSTAVTTGPFVYGLPFPSLAATVSGNWSVYTGYSTSNADITGHINASSSKISVYVGSTTHTINGRWMGAGSYYAA